MITEPMPSKEQLKSAIEKANPDQLGRMQEMLKELGIGNITDGQAKW